MPKMEAWGLTDPGIVRKNNEDSLLIEADLSIAIVADGMGGAACGEIASALTISAVAEYVRSPQESLEAAELLKEAIREANRRVMARSQQETDCDGMGSTIVMACWTLPRVLIANVGDSRAYLWRGGQLTQLSYDQTLANELRRTLGLSEEQIANYTHKNVLTMAVGSTENLLIPTREETLVDGDEILLCSDGLYGPLGDEALAAILAEGAALRPAVEKMVEAAKQAGSDDNITAALLRYGE